KWKYDLLDVIDVGEDEAWRPVDALGEQPMDDQPGEEHDGEIGLALISRPPARLEYDREHEGIDNEHQQRIEERPRETQDRAAVAAENLALCQLHNQLAIVPKAREQRARRCRIGLIHSVSHFGMYRLRSWRSGRAAQPCHAANPHPCSSRNRVY